MAMKEEIKQEELDQEEGTKITESELNERVRFIKELEFIQLLSNPDYLHCK